MIHDDMTEEQTTDSPDAPAQDNPAQKTPVPVPRIPVGNSIEIDLVREQLENHGRVIIVREKGIYVPDRSVSLLTRALRVPRVPRTNGPTHYSIPRHVDRCGSLLASTVDFDPINWRTRGAQCLGSQALLLAKPILRYLPESGQMDWENIEETLRSNGVNGVYEPLAMALIPAGESKTPRAELYSPIASESSQKGRSRLLDMATSVFKRERADQGATTSKELPQVTEEAKTKLTEKLTTLGIQGPYIIVNPFGLSSEGVHDWAVERCAEVLRHAHEWRAVQALIVCRPEDQGKAERLRIISGSNVACIASDLNTEELNAAIAGARAVLSTPGSILVTAIQMGTGTVCISGPTTGALGTEGAVPHLVIRTTGNEPKLAAEVIGLTDHGCLEGLDAGPVARALSKVLVHQTH
jgi:hypothetical protein